MNIRLFLSKAIATITNKPRYFPDIEWSPNSLTHNIFRVFEWLFGREYGIRPEISAVYSKTGKVTYYAHSFEGACSLFEQSIRLFLKRFEFKIEKVYLPVFATAYVPNSKLLNPYIFAIAYNTAGYNNAGTGNTSSVNIAASGSDRKAIIFVWGDFTPGDPSTTVGGSSSGVNEITRVTLTGTQKIISYYYDNPSTSSTAYAVTETGSYPEIHVITYTGCNTGGADSYASKTGDTALDLTTTVVASNCWLVSAARDYSDGDIIASTGTTQRNVGAGLKSGDSNGTVGTGSQTMNWSNNGAGNTGGIIISIKPVVATTVNSSFFNFM